jgi:hypothetical protein
LVRNVTEKTKDSSSLLQSLAVDVAIAVAPVLPGDIEQQFSIWHYHRVVQVRGGS